MQCAGRRRLGCEAAAKSLAQAASLTMVADRESDFYLLFACKPAGLDLIVRAAQDRKLAAGGCLFAALADAEPLITSPVRVAGDRRPRRGLCGPARTSLRKARR